MRLTHAVLALVAVCGGLAFWASARSAEEPLPGPEPTAPQPGAALARPAETPAPAPAPGPAADADDARAAPILEALARAEAAGDGAALKAAEARLRAEAWDAPAARRWALRRGAARAAEAAALTGIEAIRARDEARRLLSRGVFLPEFFGPDLAPTPERDRLVAVIQQLNRQVMRYGPGLEGVTRPYEVQPGDAPVLIVSRQRLGMGSNGVLFWNLGTLNPKALRAGTTILLPLEELTVWVDQARFRLALFVGDWFVKDFRVGVGRPESETPRGEFVVTDRQLNPPWTAPDGKVYKPEDPGNELGAAWIRIVNDEFPHAAGYGIHGTRKPETLGLRSSNGCVRLANPEAVELYDWVRRQDSNGGPATRVFIR